MKKFTIAALIFALLPAVAYAEEQGPPTARTDREKKEDAAIEKAYLDTMKRDRADQKSNKADPWGTLRPAGDTTKH